MWYIIISIFLIIAVSFLGFFNYSEAKNIKYTKSDISKKLVELSKKPVPQKLNIGAMCYEMAIRPNRVEYVCPICGEKTIYSNNNKIINIVNNILVYRKMIQHLNEKGLDIKLNESELCKRCYPSNNNSYSLCATITYNQSKSYKICNITKNDLQLIADLLDRKNIHTLSNDREEPLKEYIPRLQVLLGVPISDEKQ